MIKLEGPILRARFPKPQPKEDRVAPTPFRYPSTSTTSTHNPWAFEADRLDDLYKRCGDPQVPTRSYESMPREDVVALERVMVWANGAELSTKREFLAAAGQRSPGADAYAAKLRKMKLKVCWGREPTMKGSDVAQVRGRLQAMYQKPAPRGEQAGYRLKKPCKHCPFSRGPEAIKFRNRARAVEIVDTAYRHGFPCHESAVEDEEGGFRFGPDTQHCAGALMMFIADGQGSWPGVGNDRSIPDQLLHKLDWNSPYFSSEAEFLDANTPSLARDTGYREQDEGHDDDED